MTRDTLALTVGVPLELVQKVTGHKTTDIVLKYYFQPGREDFRQALQSAMPRLLTNGEKSAKEEMREMLEEVKPKPLRERLLKVWAKLCEDGDRGGVRGEMIVLFTRHHNRGRMAK